MAQDAPIQFKGVSLKVIQTRLRCADPTAVEAGLVALTGNRRDFFEHELAVLDFSEAQALPGAVDWAALCGLLRGWGLQAIATRGLPAGLAQAATEAGLPALAADALGRPARGAVAPPQAAVLAAAVEPVAVQAAVPPPGQPALETSIHAPSQGAPEADAEVMEAPSVALAAILDKPVRSGQRFYARGTDLVVLAMVSSGAEIIADGNIHVYAPLRGRALAGAGGNQAARIFTTSMEAELVSVAGIYKTFEAGVPEDLRRKPASISLAEDGESLRVLPLTVY